MFNEPYVRRMNGYVRVEDLRSECGDFFRLKVRGFDNRNFNTTYHFKLIN